MIQGHFIILSFLFAVTLCGRLFAAEPGKPPVFSLPDDVLLYEVSACLSRGDVNNLKLSSKNFAQGLTRYEKGVFNFTLPEYLAQQNLKRGGEVPLPYQFVQFTHPIRPDEFADIYPNPNVRQLSLTVRNYEHLERICFLSKLKFCHLSNLHILVIDFLTKAQKDWVNANFPKGHVCTDLGVLTKQNNQGELVKLIAKEFKSKSEKEVDSNVADFILGWKIPCTLANYLYGEALKARLSVSSFWILLLIVNGASNLNELYCRTMISGFVKVLREVKIKQERGNSLALVLREYRTTSRYVSLFPPEVQRDVFDSFLPGIEAIENVSLRHALIRWAFLTTTPKSANFQGLHISQQYLEDLVTIGRRISYDITGKLIENMVYNFLGAGEMSHAAEPVHRQALARGLAELVRPYRRFSAYGVAQIIEHSCSIKTAELAEFFHCLENYAPLLARYGVMKKEDGLNSIYALKDLFCSETPNYLRDLSDFIFNVLGLSLPRDTKEINSLILWFYDKQVPREEFLTRYEAYGALNSALANYTDERTPVEIRLFYLFKKSERLFSLIPKLKELTGGLKTYYSTTTCGADIYGADTSYDMFKLIDQADRTLATYEKFVEVLNWASSSHASYGKLFKFFWDSNPPAPKLESVLGQLDLLKRNNIKYFLSLKKFKKELGDKPQTFENVREVLIQLLQKSLRITEVYNVFSKRYENFTWTRKVYEDIWGKLDEKEQTLDNFKLLMAYSGRNSAYALDAVVTVFGLLSKVDKTVESFNVMTDIARGADIPHGGFCTLKKILQHLREEDRNFDRLCLVFVFFCDPFLSHCYWVFYKTLKPAPRYRFSWDELLDLFTKIGDLFIDPDSPFNHEKLKVREEVRGLFFSLNDTELNSLKLLPAEELIKKLQLDSKVDGDYTPSVIQLFRGLKAEERTVDNFLKLEKAYGIASKKLNPDVSAYSNRSQLKKPLCHLRSEDQTMDNYMAILTLLTRPFSSVVGIREVMWKLGEGVSFETMYSTIERHMNLYLGWYHVEALPDKYIDGLLNG